MFQQMAIKNCMAFFEIKRGDLKLTCSRSIKISKIRIGNTRQQSMLNFMRHKKPVLLKIPEFTHKLSAQCNLSSFRIMHA